MKCCLTIVSLAILADSAGAAVFTNSVSVDSFVRAAAPTLNYGGAGALSVSGSGSANGSGVTNGVFDSFFRFNTVEMVTSFNSLFGPNNWVINGVKLRVTELGAAANPIFNRGIGAFEIRWIANDNWTEGAGTPNGPATTGINYNDEPALLNSGTDVSLGAFTNAGVDAAQSFPLALSTAFVNDLRAGGEVGFYLTALDAGIGFTFDSRSFGTVSARPFLEISTVPTLGIAAINLTGTDVVLAGTNAAAGGAYYVLSSTNVALPLNEWAPVATNVPVANGDFTITVLNAANTNGPARQFFIIQTQ